MSNSNLNQTAYLERRRLYVFNARQYLLGTLYAIIIQIDN